MFQSVWPWRHAGFFIWFSLQSAARALKRASQASNECSSEIQQKEKHAWVREWQHPADVKGGSQSLLLSTYATLNNAPFQMVDPINPRLPLAPHSQHARRACGTELESPSLAQTPWQDTTDTDTSFNLGWINHYSNNIRGTKETKVSQSLLHNKNAFIAVWEWQKTFLFCFFLTTMCIFLIHNEEQHLHFSVIGSLTTSKRSFDDSGSKVLRFLFSSHLLLLIWDQVAEVAT